MNELMKELKNGRMDESSESTLSRDLAWERMRKRMSVLKGMVWKWKS